MSQGLGQLNHPGHINDDLEQKEKSEQCPNPSPAKIKPGLQKVKILKIRDLRQFIFG